MQLLMFVTVVLVGFEVSNAQVGSNFSSQGLKGEEFSECLMVNKDRRSFLRVLQDKVDECLDTMVAARSEDLQEANNLDEIRVVYKKFCDKQTSLRQCLDDLKPDAELCLTTVLQTRFKLYRDFKLMSVEVSCSQDGERSAIIRGARKHEKTISPRQRDVVDMCSFIADPNVWLDTERDPNLAMVVEYFLLQNAKECLVKYRGGEQDTLVNAVLSLWTDIMDNMKCVEHGHETLCKTIINNENMVK